MKKISLCVLVAIVGISIFTVFSLYGCSAPAPTVEETTVEETTVEETTVEEPAEPDIEYRVGVKHLDNLGEQKGDNINVTIVGVNPVLSDYSAKVYEGLETRLNEYGDQFDVVFVHYEDMSDHEGVIEASRTAILRDTDFLIAMPTDIELLIPVIEMAEDAKVPLVWYNIDPSVYLQPLDDHAIFSYIGSSQYEGGRIIGNFLVTYLHENATLGLNRGTEGVWWDDGRSNGLIDTLEEERPDVNIVVEFTQALRENAHEITLGLVSAYPDMNVIFGINTPTAMGTASAVESAGVDVGVIGFGATGEEVVAILEQRMLGSVARDPVLEGKLSAEAVIAWWEGREHEVVLSILTPLRLIYSPDLVFKYLNEAIWGEWVEENGKPEITWPEERDIPEVEAGYPDPEHIENCTWLDRWRVR